MTNPHIAPALLLAALLPAGGCISFDLGAKEIVSDTIAAGKSLYRTVRNRKDGSEERLYSHVSPIPDRQTDVEAGIGCLGYLRGLADAASGSTAEVLDESTEIVVDDEDAGRSMRCTLTAVVPRGA